MGEFKPDSGSRAIRPGPAWEVLLPIHLLSGSISLRILRAMRMVCAATYCFSFSQLAKPCSRAITRCASASLKFDLSARASNGSSAPKPEGRLVVLTEILQKSSCFCVDEIEIWVPGKRMRRHDTPPLPFAARVRSGAERRSQASTPSAVAGHSTPDGRGVTNSRVSLYARTNAPNTVILSSYFCQSGWNHN